MPPPFPAHLFLPTDSTFAALMAAPLSTQGCGPLGIQEEPWHTEEAVFLSPSLNMQVLMWTLPPHFTHGLQEARPLCAVAVRPPGSSPGTLRAELVFLVHSGRQG